MPSIVPITTQNIHTRSKRLKLEVHAHHPCEHESGRRITVTEREHFHDVVRSLCPIRATMRSNKPRVDYATAERAASSAWKHAILDGGEPLCRGFGREQVEFGMGQADDDLTVRGRAQFAESRWSGGVRRGVPGRRCRSSGRSFMTLESSSSKHALDRFKGAEVAGDHPLGNGCDKRRLSQESLTPTSLLRRVQRNSSSTSISSS